MMPLPAILALPACVALLVAPVQTARADGFCGDHGPAWYEKRIAEISAVQSAVLGLAATCKKELDPDGNGYTPQDSTGKACVDKRTEALVKQLSRAQEIFPNIHHSVRAIQDCSIQDTASKSPKPYYSYTCVSRRSTESYRDLGADLGTLYDCQRTARKGAAPSAKSPAAAERQETPAQAVPAQDTDAAHVQGASP